MRRLTQIADIDRQLRINLAWALKGVSPLNRLTIIIVTCIAVTAAFALTPANGGMVGGAFVVVDNTVGDQTYPTLDGNLAAYMDVNSGRIRYFDFVTSTSTAIPAGVPGDFDTLADVSGTRISFSREPAGGGSRACMVFDLATSTMTEIAPGAGLSAWHMALGGDTVAFIHNQFPTSNDSYLMIGNVSAPTAPLTNLGAPNFHDASPAVSPSGTAVVWERCTSTFSDCGIMRSIFSGGSWSAAEIVADTPSFETSPDTDGVHVVYDSNRPGSVGGQDIYFQPVAGGPEVQLSIDGAQRNPSISQGIIAFESAGPLGAFDLFVYVIATNTLWQVTDTPGTNELLSNISVLPNGNVRVVWAADDDIAGDNNIYARTFSLATGGNAEGKIVFVSSDPDGYQISVMDPDGTNQTQLTSGMAGRARPSFSRDGTRIVFDSYTGFSNPDIYVMNADGTNTTSLTNHPARDDHASFSPDGSLIVFMSSRDGNSEIYVMNSDGTSQTRLTNNACQEQELSFSPDGTKILFEANCNFVRDIYVMNADGTGMTNLTPNDEPDCCSSDFRPAFSPDGSKIVFASDRDGPYELYSMNANGTNPTRLTFTGTDDEPSFSPDGSKIVFSSTRDGGFGEIYVMNADGSGATRLTFDGGFSPSWWGPAPTPTPTLVMTLTPASAEVPAGDPVTWTASISDGSDEEARVVLRSAMNGRRVQFTDPGGADSPLSVSVSGLDIIVSLATNSSGALSSTAAHVAAAINASPAASTLVVAGTWPDRAGTGIVQPRPLTPLSTIYISVGSEASLPCYTSVPGWCSQMYASSESATHSIVAFLDVNGDGIRDAAEPFASGVATWVDPTPPDTTEPTISITTPANETSYTKGQSVAASYSCMDEPGGSGLASCVGSVVDGAPINTATVGSHNFTVTATDNAGNSATVTHTYTVVYDFSGFLQPVEGLPTLNVVTAGGSVSVKFSLDGNQGLAIIAAGYPKSSPIACAAGEPGVVIEETVTAGNSTLSYDATTDRYSYIWKTEKSWKGTCRMLVVKLNDNTEHLAKFRFR